MQQFAAPQVDAWSAEVWPPQDEAHACVQAVQGLHGSDEAKISAIHQIRELCLPQTEFCVQNRIQVGSLGGIELMAALLDSPSDDMQRQVCLALNEACLKNMPNSHMLCHCGAIRSLMNILDSGNPDLQTQALAVLGTSAVNSVEVRFELQDCGAIRRLVALLGARTPSVQEWAAYALRKACSRSSNLQLSQSMIEQAKEEGAVRALIRMLDLPSHNKDPKEEAQQTLDYFSVDDSQARTIREQMQREGETKPLVRLQQLCWVAAAHARLGENAAPARLPAGLVKRVGLLVSAAARPAVVFRYRTQGLAWVGALDWQRRAAVAETTAAKQEEEVNALEQKLMLIPQGQARIQAIESRLEGLERVLSGLVKEEQHFVSEADIKSVQEKMSGQLTALLSSVGGLDGGDADAPSRNH